MAKRKKNKFNKILPSLIFAILGILILIIVIAKTQNPNYYPTQASGFKSLTPGTDNTSLKRDLKTMEKSLDIYEELVK